MKVEAEMPAGHLLSCGRPRFCAGPRGLDQKGGSGTVEKTACDWRHALSVLPDTKDVHENKTPALAGVLFDARRLRYRQVLNSGLCGSISRPLRWMVVQTAWSDSEPCRSLAREL